MTGRAWRWLWHNQGRYGMDPPPAFWLMWVVIAAAVVIAAVR